MSNNSNPLKENIENLGKGIGEHLDNVGKGFENVGKNVDSFFKSFGKKEEKREVVAPAVVYPVPGPLGTYVAKPLDVILFAVIIIQYVKVEDDKPTAGWTHAGLLVDYSVLPLPEINDGKLCMLFTIFLNINLLYSDIYESIFTGTIAGYTYSNVFPADHPGAKAKGMHAGPQLRPFVEVVNETVGDIGICVLHQQDRDAAFADISKLQTTLIDFHSYHKEFSYPFGVLPQLASASEGLEKFLSTVNKVFFKEDELEARAERKAIFCSELAALLYGTLGVRGFDIEKAGSYSPLEIEITPAFTDECHWAKYDGKNYVLEDGHTLVKTDIVVIGHDSKAKTSA
ncbi:hypothetical protein HK096_004123 [Nowakowskiella sp. JEL0078]|nr:hypothetical protein HK096_004123 [Nowakowskiella sp. JEL0078]